MVIIIAIPSVETNTLNMYLIPQIILNWRTQQTSESNSTEAAATRQRRHVAE